LLAFIEPRLYFKWGGGSLVVWAAARSLHFFLLSVRIHWILPSAFDLSFVFYTSSHLNATASPQSVVSLSVSFTAGIGSEKLALADNHTIIRTTKHLAMGFVLESLLEIQLNHVAIEFIKWIIDPFSKVF
jgi:hypothetical protein